MILIEWDPGTYFQFYKLVKKCGQIMRTIFHIVYIVASSVQEC
jgi:hypothetical protein